MSPAAVEGVGIHSGERCRVWLHRDDGPLRFRTGGAEVVALVESVVATPRCTIIGNGDHARVATVEHLLAALRVAGFWSGVVVEVDGPELPILDGSALPWYESLRSLGPAPAAPPAWRPTAPVTASYGASRVRLEPGDERLATSIDYDHPAIGAQRWCGAPAEYRELLSSRTYATMAELHALRAAGGLLGAAEGRGIVFGDGGPLGALRWPDEPVRHKALDALGDFTLLGFPLQGSLSIDRGSHAAHVAFMQQLRTLAPAPPATTGS